MLIRLINEELVEYPDDLGALVLADPTQGDLPDFILDEVNCLINGALGVLFDEELTLEQNIQQARAYYALRGTPDPANLEKAQAQIKNYKENIALVDIGYSDRDVVHAFYGIQSSRRNLDDNNIIDHVPGSPTKLLAFGEAPEVANQKTGGTSTP